MIVKVKWTFLQKFRYCHTMGRGPIFFESHILMIFVVDNTPQGSTSFWLRSNLPNWFNSKMYLAQDILQTSFLSETTVLSINSQCHRTCFLGASSCREQWMCSFWFFLFACSWWFFFVAKDWSIWPHFSLFLFVRCSKD